MRPATDETLIVATILYNVDPPASKEAFLKFVQNARANDPDIGRFESIRNAEELYEERPETCVLYRAASKDRSTRAVRGGQYTVFETIGMHCVHPDKPNVGVQVELSRKAPPGTTDPGFEAAGLALLESVRFGPF